MEFLKPFLWAVSFDYCQIIYFRVEPNISGTEFKHIKSRFYCQSFQSISFVLLDSCRPKNMITKLPLLKWTSSSPLLSFPFLLVAALLWDQGCRRRSIHTLTFKDRTCLNLPHVAYIFPLHSASVLEEFKLKTEYTIYHRLKISRLWPHSTVYLATAQTSNWYIKFSTETVTTELLYCAEQSKHSTFHHFIFSLPDTLPLRCQTLHLFPADTLPIHCQTLYLFAARHFTSLLQTRYLFTARHFTFSLPDTSLVYPTHDFQKIEADTFWE